MRIAAIVHQFAPRYETGTETLCLRSMQALRSRGHAVMVVTARHDRRTGGRPERAVVEGIDVVEIPAGQPWHVRTAERLAADAERPTIGRTVVDMVQEFRADLVHVHHLKHFGFSTCASLGVPVVYTVTDRHLVCPLFTALLDDGRPCREPGTDLPACACHLRGRGGPRDRAGKTGAVFSRLLHGSTGRIRAALERRRTAAGEAVASAARLFTASLDIVVDLSRLGADPHRVRLLPHAVPTVEVTERDVGVPLRIGFYGTLLPHKGAKVLIEALLGLPVDVDFEARLWGRRAETATHAAELAAMIRDERRITIHDVVPQSRFGKVLGWADIVVVPSLWGENTPLVLTAALEARRYVVVSDGSGLTASISSNSEGRIVPAGDAAALADALTALLRDPTPVVERRRAVRPDNGFVAYVDALEDEYRAVLAEHGAIEREICP